MEASTATTLRWVITVIVLVPTFLWVLRVYYIIGAGKGTHEAINSNKEHLSNLKWAKITQKILAQCGAFCRLVGGGLSTVERFKWDYRMLRADLVIPEINRAITSEEIVGIIRVIQTLLIFIGGGAFLITGNVLLLVLLIIAFLLPRIIGTFFDTEIKWDDETLDHDFPDLYLLLYSRLQKGVKANLYNTLQDYLKTLEAIYRAKDKLVMKKFVKDFIIYIDLYGRETDAIKELRKKYHSATLINFCNIACQALDGVDNSDKLLSFKIELADQQRRAMEKVALERCERGRKSIFAIYIILGEFVVISWASRLNFERFSLTGMM